jgi:hypothetical protein
MIVFYSGLGATGFEILSPSMPDDKWIPFKGTVSRLLKSREKDRAAELLDSIPFQLSEGTNYFGDEFLVLHITTSVERYIEFSELKKDPQTSSAFRQIAEAFRELGKHVRFIAVSPISDTKDLVPQPNPEITTEAVERALKDSQQLIFTSGAASAVDRVHTALHGYLRAICSKKHFQCSDRASLTELFKVVRTNHSSLKNSGIGMEESKKLLGALATMVDTINTLRNGASIAHPNDKILEEAEAVLAINCTRTILHYLDTKLK